MHMGLETNLPAWTQSPPVTSEIKISVLVHKADSDRAVEAIHQKFFEN